MVHSSTRMMASYSLWEGFMSMDSQLRDKAEAKIALYGIGVALALIAVVLSLMYL
jgi:hypothetical protein